MKKSFIINRTILTDVDGVLLNWINGFIVFMSKKGIYTNNDYFGDYGLDKWFQITPEEVKKYIREFNESAAIGFLKPLDGAVEGINKLKELGFTFRAITSLSDDPYAANLRKQNLENVFGSNTFDDIICLKQGECKKEELKKQKRLFGEGVFTYWVEDHLINAEAGSELGFQTIVINHLHNQNWSGVSFNDWIEVCHYIASELQYDTPNLHKNHGLKVL